VVPCVTHTFVNYEAQVGQSNFIAQTVDGGLKIGF
jgi:hypothetical protein